ncbi:hypothetical protein [Methylicorpusculum sp.]|uniref:hypothetical protein n=1 Tax=Methylicorpusculum sp. TaxID=2713644 RepID=UPI002AC9BA0C|nr:hypothetical protein [Methylicorpusculum sp.]
MWIGASLVRNAVARCPFPVADKFFIIKLGIAGIMKVSCEKPGYYSNSQFEE